MKQHSISERHACRLTKLARSTKRYAPRQRADEQGLRKRLRELAVARPSFGYRRLGALLRREGVRVNDKRVHRLYREEGLSLRRKRRKRLRRGLAPSTTTTSGRIARWAIELLRSSPARSARPRDQRMSVLRTNIRPDHPGGHVTDGTPYTSSLLDIAIG